MSAESERRTKTFGAIARACKEDVQSPFAAFAGNRSEGHAVESLARIAVARHRTETRITSRFRRLGRFPGSSRRSAPVRPSAQETGRALSSSRRASYIELGDQVTLGGPRTSLHQGCVRPICAHVQRPRACHDPLRPRSLLVSLAAPVIGHRRHGAPSGRRLSRLAAGEGKQDEVVSVETRGSRHR